MTVLVLALGIAGGFLFAPVTTLALAVALLVPRGWVIALVVMLFGGGR